MIFSTSSEGKGGGAVETTGRLRTGTQKLLRLADPHLHLPAEHVLDHPVELGQPDVDVKRGPLDAIALPVDELEDLQDVVRGPVIVLHHRNAELLGLVQPDLLRRQAQRLEVGIEVIQPQWRADRWLRADAVAPDVQELHKGGRRRRPLGGRYPGEKDERQENQGPNHLDDSSLHVFLLAQRKAAPGLGCALCSFSGPETERKWRGGCRSEARPSSSNRPLLYYSAC